MNQQPNKRALEVVEIRTSEVVHSVDVTGKPESVVHRTLCGMLLNMDTDKFFVRDTADQADTCVGRITGVRFTALTHRKALIEAGYEQAPADVGDKVLVSLDNGWEDEGVVLKIYKNGARRVRRSTGETGNRSFRDLWRKKVDHTANIPPSPPLPVGVYVLQSDVPNPKRDKRMTADWRHVPVFLKGLQVRVVAKIIPRSSGDTTVFVMEPWHDFSHLALALDDARVLAMLPHLTPATDVVDVTDEKVRQLTYDSLAHWAPVVLSRLLRSGELPPERVIAMVSAAHNEDL